VARKWKEELGWKEIFEVESARLREKGSFFCLL
jgi:hypothetical protein